MRLLVIVCLLALVSCATRPEGLTEFRSDGCSSFPDGTRSHPNKWLSPCIQHDFAYWQGGTWEQRVEADLELKRAVIEGGNPVVARLIYLGVRLGGSPWWPTSWRWGFGWPYPRGYQELSEDEKRQVTLKTP